MDKNRIHPHIVAEFDDSALMKKFIKEGAGIFLHSSLYRVKKYNVKSIGHTDK